MTSAVLYHKLITTGHQGLCASPKLHKHTLGSLPLYGDDIRKAREPQMLKRSTAKLHSTIVGKHHAQPTIGLKESLGNSHKVAIGEGGGVTCHATLRIWGVHSLGEEGRVGEYVVIPLRATEGLDIATMYHNTFCPGATCHICTCLRRSLLNNIYRLDMSLHIALCRHDSYKACACAYIEDIATPCDICPRTKKHTIGAYLHCALGILYCEVLKLKHR